MNTTKDWRDILALARILNEGPPGEGSDIGAMILDFHAAMCEGADVPESWSKEAVAAAFAARG